MEDEYKDESEVSRFFSFYSNVFAVYVLLDVFLGGIGAGGATGAG